MRSTLIHPHTGEPLVPHFLRRKDGTLRSVWPILGAGPDDDPDSGGADDKDDDEEDNDAGDKGDDSATQEKIDKAEYDKVVERMKAADRRAAAAEKAVKDAELKDASELEKANAALKEAEAARAKLEADNRAMLLNQALLTHVEYGAPKWEDPNDIVEMAQRAVAAEDITIEEDGTIKGLDKWLKGVASKKPYLLRKEDDKSGSGTGASGTGVGSGKNNNGNKDLSEEELRRKFPALNR